MTSSELWSDGNALAGPVGDLFRVDVTSAVGCCTACQHIGFTFNLRRTSNRSCKGINCTCDPGKS